MWCCTPGIRDKENEWLIEPTVIQWHKKWTTAESCRHLVLELTGAQVRTVSPRTHSPPFLLSVLPMTEPPSVRLRYLLLLILRVTVQGFWMEIYKELCVISLIYIPGYVKISIVDGFSWHLYVRFHKTHFNLKLAMYSSEKCVSINPLILLQLLDFVTNTVINPIMHMRK